MCEKIFMSSSISGYINLVKKTCENMREKNVVMRINKTDISKIKIKHEKLLDVEISKKNW